MDKIAAYEILLSTHPLWSNDLFVKEAIDADELMNKVRNANNVMIGPQMPQQMAMTIPTRRQYPHLLSQDRQTRQMQQEIDQIGQMENSPVFQRINQRFPKAGEGVTTVKQQKELALRMRKQVPPKSVAGSILIDPKRIARGFGGGKLSPEGERALTGVITSHELAERRVRPEHIQALESHMAPEVLLKERNAVARLTGAGADEARKAMTELRYGTGEADWMRNLLTDQYGPRAAQFLEGEEKVPKAILRNLRRRIQQNPGIVDKAEPFARMGTLEKLKRRGALLAQQGRMLKGMLP
jgi:hypothetical protein